MFNAQRINIRHQVSFVTSLVWKIPCYGVHSFAVLLQAHYTTPFRKTMIVAGQIQEGAFQDDRIVAPQK